MYPSLQNCNLHTKQKCIFPMYKIIKKWIFFSVSVQIFCKDYSIHNTKMHCQHLKKVECTIAGLRHAFISAFCTYIVVCTVHIMEARQFWFHCYYKCNNLALGVISTVDIKSLVLQLPIKKLHTRLDIIFFYLQVSMCNGDQGKIKSLIVHVHNILCCMHHLI